MRLIAPALLVTIVGLAMPLTVTYAISYEDAERQVGDFEARRH